MACLIILRHSRVGHPSGVKGERCSVDAAHGVLWECDQGWQLHMHLCIISTNTNTLFQVKTHIQLVQTLAHLSSL